MRATTRAAVPSEDAVLVAIDGSGADVPVLTWAAEEADRTRRPLVITYAAGHLPPQLTYAERPSAREQRLDEGREVTENAAAWVRAQSPAVRVDTVVRLLQPSMLLPALGDRARTLAQSGASWISADRAETRGPVLAALATAADAHVLRDATDYAGRRGLEVMVLDGARDDLAYHLVERSKDVSMVFLSSPQRGPTAKTLSWTVALDAVARSLSPVVLVSGDAVSRSARGLG
jgi:hypothetical protein